MKKLFLMRGAPGCGKSTWIKEKGLKSYTLCADDIRLLFQSPILNIDGDSQISQANDKEVWKFIFQLLEKRMQRGEFTVIDATHSSSKMINQYKQLCQKYRYRCYIVDLSDVDLETCIKRNFSREYYKKVPEEVIRKIYARFSIDKLPSWVELIKCNDFEKIFSELHSKFFDFSEYEKIVIFGDIHGCYEPLKNYFNDNPYSNKNYYIFTGDYFDRGIQNTEVFNFLYDFMNNKNVLLLHGNHEYHIFDYGWGDINNEIKSKDFLETIKQFEKNNICSKDNKKKIREFYYKIGQYASFSYGENDKRYYVITHGGVPNVPNIFDSSNQIIKGVGKYKDSKEVDLNWCKNTEENYFSIHAHRNIYNEAIHNTEKTYNLCSKIEFGEELRILEITPDNNIEELKYKNEIYNKNLEDTFSEQYIKDVENYKKEGNNEKLTDDEKTINHLINNKDVIKKNLGDNIVSFNFSKKVFRKRSWDQENCKARGLFINTQNNKIICRSYSKFFNWGEREETKSKNLANNLKFPINIYKKYNGFLGLLSYNPMQDDFFIASKSSNKSEHTEYFKNIFNNMKIDKIILKQFLKEHNVTFIFEVIDQDNDPHIIKYKENKIILLDIVKNLFSDEFYSYLDLKKVSDKFNFKIKKHLIQFDEWESLYTWRNHFKDDIEIPQEGCVIEDSNNFRIKLKTKYYSFWKYFKGIKDNIVNNRYIDIRKFNSEEDINIYKFMVELNKNNLLKDKNIIQLRDLYLEKKNYGN